MSALGVSGNLILKTWKNRGKVMKFCESVKVGTLDAKRVGRS